MKNKIVLYGGMVVGGLVALVAPFLAMAQSVASGTFNASDTIAVVAPAAQSFHDTFILLMEWLIPITIVVALILWGVSLLRSMGHGNR